MTRPRRTIEVAPDETSPVQKWRGPLITTTEMSAKTRLSTQTLAQKRLLGGFLGYTKLGSRVFYFEDEVNAWILSRRRTSTSDIIV